MLTLRHIEDNGFELIIPVLRVWRSPRSPTRAIAPVYASEVGSEHPLMFASGKLYVMNGSGKTVAVYDFTDEPEDFLPKSMLE